MGYTKYQYRVVKLDKHPYWPRADDPMKMVTKEWEKALYVSRFWGKESIRKAYIYDDEVAKQVRPTIIMDKPNQQGMRGARFANAQEFEGVPYGDNESDLKALRAEYERQYRQNTIENTAARIKTMLSMLGDVQVIDGKEIGNVARYQLQWYKNFKLFEVKGQKLVLFEAEEVE